MSFTNYTDVVREHDEVVFFGGRDLMFAATIVDGEMIRNQKGEFKCADVIGLPYGGKVKARHGSGFMYVLRPTPELWSLVLSHRTQIIYAADIAMICYQLDLCAGSRVLETGTGSGSLTHALARAVGPQGRVFSFDFHQQRVEIARDEFARHGLTNVQVAHADATMPDAWGLHEEVDAVFFDLPKPHLALDNAVAAFRPTGGRLCSFSPCIEQVQTMCDALRARGFRDVVTVEVLERTLEVSRSTVQTLDLEAMSALHETSEKRAAEDQAGTGQGPPKRAKKGATPSKVDSTAVQTVLYPQEDKGHTGYLTFASWQPRCS